ncbi:hypothetical protein NL335_25345, partial [Klebsiella pneumoniae]|nr:hypothetical protein [Klebsiella pneumoniae]MCP6269422.1 hypothetical protein [Klebsiella pneumoniae]
LIETEATGAPQKHHHTLNQQIGSITEMMGYFLRIDSERNPSAGSAITRIISGNIRGDCALGFP